MRDRFVSHTLLPGLVWLAILIDLISLSVSASDIDPALAQSRPDPDFAKAVLTDKGSDGCLRCHEDDEAVNVMAIFQSPHGFANNPSSPFANDHCESCHGPGSEHSKRVRRGETRPAMLSFSVHQLAAITQSNQQCQTCHAGQLNQWHSSEHQAADLQCTQCHSVHVKKDPILNRQTQAAVCTQCHSQQRSDSLKLSHHPFSNGEVTCSDCHSAHQSVNEYSLKQFTVNQNCTQCHAEKRGPFLWEHAPASEDCSSCHTAHGSMHPALLKRRAPLLCQQCHNASDHSSRALTATDLAAQRAEIFLLANSCTNCHSHVHGSNHPLGQYLNR